MSLFVLDLSGNDPFKGIVVGDPKTKLRGFNNYLLVGSVNVDGSTTPVASIASGARSAPVYNVTGGSYNFFAAAASLGAAGTLQLQYLGDDNVWYNLGTALAANGSTGVVIAEGSTIAVLVGGNTITGVVAEIG